MSESPIILSHRTALEWLRALALRDFTITCARYRLSPLSSIRILELAMPRVADVQAAFGASDRHVELLVNNAGSRCHSSWVTAHTLRRAPRLPFLWRGRTTGLFVCSPELVFYQLSGHSTLAETALLGLELCGSFSLSPSGDMGLVERPPLTCPRELARTLDAFGAGPQSVARRALGLIAPNSASPMESRTYLLMVAPSRLGGWQLPAPIMNGEVGLGERESRLLGCERLYCDLLWPEQRVAVEYDSLTFHGSSSSLARTLDRRTALEGAGYSVLSLTASDLSSYEAFERKMTYLRRLLKRRFRKPSEAVVHARRALIRELTKIAWV